MGEIEKRMKDLRGKTDYHLPKKTYIMCACDGRSFSRLIKNNYEKPFDDKFISMMNEVAIYVCKNVQGCCFEFLTQSICLQRRYANTLLKFSASHTLQSNCARGCISTSFFISFDEQGVLRILSVTN